MCSGIKLLVKNKLLMGYLQRYFVQKIRQRFSLVTSSSLVKIVAKSLHDDKISLFTVTHALFYIQYFICEVRTGGEKCHNVYRSMSMLMFITSSAAGPRSYLGGVSTPC